MTNKVDTLNLDADFEAETAIAEFEVQELIKLQDEDPKLYNQAICNLQAIAQGYDASGPYAGYSPVVADTILMNLDVEQVDAERADIKKAIANDNEVAFMGNPGSFVQLDEAIESGELGEEYR